MKPEVASVMGFSVDNYGYSLHGTSFSTPALAAMVANNMDHSSFYIIRPEAVKAVVLGGAVNNLEGKYRLSNKDGAGGFDFRHMLWRGAHYFEGPNHHYFDCQPGGHCVGRLDGYHDVYGYVFPANRRIRATVVWGNSGRWSFENRNINGLASPQMDFDLYVFRKDTNELVASSISYDNTYEIVDFCTPANVEYVFRIQRHSNRIAQDNSLSHIKLAFSAGYGDFGKKGQYCDGSIEELTIPSKTIKSNTPVWIWPFGQP